MSSKLKIKKIIIRPQNPILINNNPHHIVSLVRCAYVFFFLSLVKCRSHQESWHSILGTGKSQASQNDVSLLSFVALRSFVIMIMWLCPLDLSSVCFQSSELLLLKLVFCALPAVSGRFYMKQWRQTNTLSLWLSVFLPVKLQWSNDSHRRPTFLCSSPFALCFLSLYVCTSSFLPLVSVLSALLSLLPPPSHLTLFDKCCF